MERDLVLAPTVSRREASTASATKRVTGAAPPAPAAGSVEGARSTSVPRPRRSLLAFPDKEDTTKVKVVFSELCDRVDKPTDAGEKST